MVRTVLVLAVLTATAAWPAVIVGQVDTFETVTPEGWFAAASEPDSQQRFRLTLEEKPKDANGTVPLLLTLVADGQAAHELPAPLPVAVAEAVADLQRLAALDRAPPVAPDAAR